MQKLNETRQPPPGGSRAGIGRLLAQPRWLVIAGAVVCVAAGAIFWGRGGKAAGKAPTFAARRGPLEISVLEGGSLQALESQEIKCEVRVGYQGTKILKIVEEGYQVTDEDVRTNKVLVELDSSDLQKQLVEREIQYQSALAGLIDAQQAYEIQLNQNQSDIKSAEQKARFARLDFDKFLGDAVTERVIVDVGLDRLLAEATTNDVAQTTRALEASADSSASAPNGQGTGSGPANLPKGVTVSAGAATQGQNGDLKPVTVPVKAGELQRAGGAPAANVPATALVAGGPPAATPAAEPSDSVAGTNSIKFDFSPYAHIEKLGDGEAKQKLRNFEDELQVAKKALEQAKTTLDGTQRLLEKGYVTKTDLQRDEIAHDNSRLKVQTATSARDLFLKYDFLKSAEEALSKYAEAVRELDKARRVAISKAAQAKARLKSAQGQHQIQLRQRDDLVEQLQKCTLCAKKPGLVVYGSAGDESFYYGDQERIREGATVRERQAIITIPDMSRMSVKVKIHESYIKKIKKGQRARITVDAFPDKALEGEVTKVGVLPDTQWRWMNPDMKVYLTTITIDSTQDWIKPGMSAKVEILVNKIDSCVYVPVQAVSADGDKQVCFVSRSLQPERREVQIGEFNDEFIEVKGGIKEGELVLLRPPEGVGAKKPGQEPKTPDKGKEPAKTAPAVAAASTAPAKK